MSDGVNQLTKTALWQHQIDLLQAAIEADERLVVKTIQELLASPKGTQLLTTPIGQSLKKYLPASQPASTSAQGVQITSATTSQHQADTPNHGDRMRLWAMGVENVENN